MNSVTANRVFEMAAELFALLSTPTRLRIVCELCKGEKNVSELLNLIAVSQPNISQQLGMLYRGGVVGRRRVGSQVYYRIISERVQLLSDAVCTEQAHALSRSRTALDAQ
jgi:DNA-binding transcriptional ArsR family regulator